jgi:hypothetical protein
MALATLSIDIVAQLAKFEADMGRAAGVVERSAQRMERGFGGLKSVFAGSLLSSFANDAARAAVRLLPSLVEGVAAFQDLEEKTGASAEALASFATAGDVSGTSADQLADAMVKLTGNLSKVSTDTKGAGAALKALGLDYETFRKLKPEEQFATLAERLAGFRDGAGKTSIALALLGRNGAALLPFFKELAQSGLSQNRLTAEQIRLADELVDRNARLRSELKQAAQVAALQMLPAITALGEEFAEAAKEALGFDGALTKVGGNNTFRDFAQDSVIVIGDIVDAMNTLQGAINKFNVGPPLSIKGLNDATKKELAFIKDTVLSGEKALILPPVFSKYLASGGDKTPTTSASLGDRLRDRFDSENRIADTPELASEQRRLLNRAASAATLGQLDPLRVEDDKLGNGNKAANKVLREAEQERKAILDAQLRALDAALGAERDRLDFHGDYLERVYQTGALSVREFYDERRAIEARGLQQQLASFKAEEEALRAFLDKTTDPSERARTQGRIDDIAAKSADALQRYSQQAVLGYQAQASATQQATDRLREFQAQLLELEGDAAGAARLRADAAIEQARRSARSIGLPPDELASFERATRAAEELGNAQRNVQRITSQLALDEERIAIAAAQSGASRAQVERDIFQLRVRALQQLQRELDAAESLAVGTNPNSEAAQFAQQLRLEFERATAAVDPLRTRLMQLADDVGERWAGLIEDALLDGDWQQAGETILRDIARGLINEQFTQPLKNALSGILRGGIGGAGSTSGEGGLGTLLGGGVLGFNKPPSATVVPGFAGGQIDVSKPLEVLGSSAAESAASLAGLGKDSAIVSQIMALLPTSALTPTASALATLNFVGIQPATASLAYLSVMAEAAAASLSLVSASGGAGDDLFKLFGDAVLGSFGSGSVFSAGGWTGPAPVQTPAGVVHGQEFVFSAPAVRRLGLPMLERLHREGRAGAPRVALPGYADGGLVSSWRGNMGGAGGGGNVVNNVIVQGVSGQPKTTRRRNATGGEDLYLQFRDQVRSDFGDEIDSGFGLAKNISGRFTLNDGASLPR